MRRKVYGQSQETPCAFCGNRATCKSDQHLPTCQHHRRENVKLRCTCREWLDVKESKYGTFFVCMNCGPITYKKGLEMNDLPLPSVDEL